MSPCSLNDMLHSSLIINCTFAAAVGKGLCVCSVQAQTFFVTRKVLSQQFLIDQHVEIVCFFHIAVFGKSLLSKTV